MRSDQIERNKHFIDEIITELRNFESRGGRPSPSIVFLFRSVFADFGVFDALSPCASELSVEFFDQAQRENFLTEYLNSKASNSSSPRASKGHLSAAFLNGFESILSKAKDQAAGFFGHAIVLSAFGDYLHEQEETNATHLAKSLADDDLVEATSVTLLTRIIAKILDREVGKFPTHDYTPHLPTFEPYSTEIQEALLRAVAEDEMHRRAGLPSTALETAVKQSVAALEVMPAFTNLPSQVSENLRSNYENELTSRITHHPFVDIDSKGKTEFRNPVYREYYLAKLVSSQPTRNWDVISKVSDYSYYLGLFFLNSVPDRDLSKHVGFMFQLISLLATSSSGNDYQFNLQWQADQKRWEGTVESCSVNIHPFFIDEPILSIAIPLQGILQNVAIKGGTDGLLEVTGPGPENAHADPIVLRDCLFEAAEFTISAAAVRFDKVSILCDEFRVGDIGTTVEGISTLTLRSHSQQQVALYMSDYAKSRWQKALLAAGDDNGEGGEALFQRKLSKMLLWFRKHGRSEYAIYGMKFQTYVLSGNTDKKGRALADFLFDNRFIWKQESLIVMDQAAFAQCDIYYEKQNEIRFGDKASELYRDFISSTHGAAFL